MNDIFEVRGNIYNIKNFQSLYSSCKKIDLEVKRLRTEVLGSGT